MRQRCSGAVPKIAGLKHEITVNYVCSQGAPNLAFFESLNCSEIAANTGGQAAMVEDRLGRKSQLDFNPC